MYVHSIKHSLFEAFTINFTAKRKVDLGLQSQGAYLRDVVMEFRGLVRLVVDGDYMSLLTCGYLVENALVA